MAQQHTQAAGSGQHTPGPWGLRCAFSGSVGTKDQLTAMAYPSGADQSAEMWANARLIAAAPEMLAALIVAREFISTDRNSLADTCMHPDGHMDRDDSAAVADYDQELLQINAVIKKAGAA